MPRDYTSLRRHQRHRIFVLNDQTVLRLHPALAVEIGLNESLLLLQLEYLISISRHEHEGRIWTYQSLNDLQENYFPFLSRATIGRTLKSLEEKRLIIRGNFNRAAFDRTAWFALDEEGIAQLTAIRLGEHG